MFFVNEIETEDIEYIELELAEASENILGNKTELVKEELKDEIFNKLRQLEFSCLYTVFHIERIKTNILLSARKDFSAALASLMEKENESLFIINKKNRKIKRQIIIKKLKEGRLKEVLETIHFPSNKILELGEKYLAKEEFKLLKKITKDEKETVQAITAMHYPLVLKEVSSRIRANSYFAKYKEDLINEGFTGLIEAVYKFDVEKKNKFSTYAVPWIKYRISLFVNQNLKEIETQNGIYKKQTFSKKVFLEDKKEYFEDFKEKIYDYDFEVPLAYLFPKLDFNKKTTLRSNLNMILSNHSYAKRIVDYCKKNEVALDIIDKYSQKPIIAARFILQRFFPYLEKVKHSVFGDEEQKRENYFVLKEESFYKKYEQEMLLEYIFSMATQREKEMLEKYLNEEISFKKIEPVIRKIKARIKN